MKTKVLIMRKGLQPLLTAILVAQLGLPTGLIAGTSDAALSFCLGDLESYSQSFPIERLYPNVQIRFDSKDRPILPHGKAFSLWRERTPPHLSDEVFLWHYLTDEQLERVILSLTISRMGLEETLNAITLYDINTLLSTFGQLGRERGRVYACFLLYRVEGKIRLSFFRVGLHTEAWLKVRRAFLGAEFLAGGRIFFEIEGGSEGEVRWVPREVTNSCWIRERCKTGALDDLFVILEEALPMQESTILWIAWKMPGKQNIFGKRNLQDWRALRVLP